MISNIVLSIDVVLSGSIPQEVNWLLLGGRIIDDFPPSFLALLYFPIFYIKQLWL